MSSELFYPFGSQPSSSNVPFPYDVVIGEAFPGVVFVPQEASGIYQEIREVAGDLWIVSNAGWVASVPNWFQLTSVSGTTIDFTKPAFAWVYRANGTVTRYYAPATGGGFTPVAWQPLFNIDQNGDVTVSAQTLTLASQIAQQITATWNAGVGVVMEALRVNITDTSSASSSKLLDLLVNGVSKFSVDKSGNVVDGSGLFAKYGTQANVVADGTALTTVTFPTPFPTSCANVQATVINDPTVNAWSLGAPQVSNISVAGFKVAVTGAPPGSTVTVHWAAKGN